MRVAIIGGGPSGLYLAILLKAWGVASDITVMEQNPKDATYGFGVGIGEGALDQLAQADAESHKGIMKKLHWSSGQTIENPDGKLELSYLGEAGTIERLALLQVLHARCDALDIDVRHGVRVNDLADLSGYDLVVAADGANSKIRTDMADKFGLTRELLGNRFAWYGFNKALPSALRFRRRGDDVFIAHYYPYTPTMSTFLVEVDRQTWEDNGFGALTDDERKKTSEDVFSDVLEGGSLIDNRSNWSQFETAENARWSFGNIVLIGDAQHRAHFSIGSGTRLAMEDTLSLATALRENSGSVEAALEAYEATRRPWKQKLTSAAQKSYVWYDNIRDVIDLPTIDFCHNFMTRTGRMPDERLRKILPEFMVQYDAYQAA